MKTKKAHLPLFYLFCLLISLPLVSSRLLANTPDFNKVMMGIIVNEDYVFNKESVIKLNGLTLFIQQIEFYDSKKKLVKVEISKPEGALIYTIDELKSDTSLIKHFQLNRSKTTIKEGILFDMKLNAEQKYKVIYSDSNQVLAQRSIHFILLTNTKKHG